VVEKPKFSLKPKTAAAAPVEAAPAPAPAAEPPMVEAPPPFPPPAFPPAPEGASPAVGPSPFPPPVAAAPFPPPAGGVFPPPAAGKFPPGAPGKKKAAPGGSKKKLIFISGGVLALVLVLAGGFLFTGGKPEAPAPVVKATPPPAAAPVETQPAAQPEPVAATPAPVETKPVVTPPPAAAVVAEPVVQAPVVPEPPPPPPPPSAQFKAWVEGLKIGGVSVRAGRPPRMIIEKTTYDVGDLVNPNLGISFEGYNPTTRMVTFKDKTGATVERRDRQ
jgi:hypothetical protein